MVEHNGKKWGKGLCRVSNETDILSKSSKSVKKVINNSPCHTVIPNTVFTKYKILINIKVYIMTEIEKFLNEQFTQVITEDKMGIKCLYKHKEGVIDDGVVFFEFAKKKWSRKPIMNKRQFVIVDADMSDVLQFLHQYYNLSEQDYSNIRHYIINTSIKKVEEFFGGD